MKGKGVHREVMGAIVAELERGVLPWAPPWERSEEGGGIPFNYHTGRPYSRGNVLLLWMAMKEHGFTSPAFVTYRQAHEAGGHVLKGETGVPLVFWAPGARKKESDDEEGRRAPVLRRFTVFNVAQTSIEGADKVKAPTLDLTCGDVIEAHGVDVRVGGVRAYYSPSGDFVRMPPREKFVSREAYEAVLLHEAVHWTGHESRCARPRVIEGDRESLAREELVAEIGSAFMSARLGLPYRPTHATYIEHFLKLLQSDERELFRAAKEADRAVEYLHARLREREHPRVVERENARERLEDPGERGRA